MNVEQARAWIATLSRMQKALLLTCMAGGGLALSIMLGGVLATGAIVGSILVVSAVFSIMRMKSKYRKFLLRHPVVTNLIATAMVATVVGVSSVTGLVTVAMTFLGIDIAQKIAGYLAHEEPDETNTITLSKLSYSVKGSV